jgi:hypothetical protein
MPPAPLFRLQPLWALEYKVCADLAAVGSDATQAALILFSSRGALEAEWARVSLTQAADAELAKLVAIATHLRQHSSGDVRTLMMRRLGTLVCKLCSPPSLGSECSATADSPSRSTLATIAAHLPTDSAATDACEHPHDGSGGRLSNAHFRIIEPLLLLSPDAREDTQGRVRASVFAALPHVVRHLSVEQLLRIKPVLAATIDDLSHPDTPTRKAAARALGAFAQGFALPFECVYASVAFAPPCASTGMRHCACASTGD